MRLPSLLILLAVFLLPLLPTPMQAGPEQSFWSWFQVHESDLFDFEAHQEQTFDALSTALHLVDERLTFEFGPKQAGKREFVLSADGLREAFPAVEALHAAAPKLPRWTFVKFRPRREPMDVFFQGMSVRAAQVRFTLMPAAGKVDIVLFLPGDEHLDSEKMIGIGFLLLDHALGEFDVETKVGEINVQPLKSAPAAAKPLGELGRAFDACWSANKPAGT